jgi:predicted DNA-binding transcriptional regulator YafY
LRGASKLICVPYSVRLKELGIPVDSTPGVGGAYRLRSGFRIPPLLFTNEEALALALGLHALRHVGLESFAPATEGALAKLERVLPTTIRESVRTIEDAVLMEPSPWMVPTPGQTLVDASAAIRNCHRIRFRYESHTKATSEREIEPYAVLHADDRWYLVGFCLSRQELRTFRLDHLSKFETCEETFCATQQKRGKVQEGGTSSCREAGERGPKPGKDEGAGRNQQGFSLPFSGKKQRRRVAAPLCRKR